MSELRHSIEQAVEIQKDFEQLYTKVSGVVGVGIGLNEKHDDLAINVQVAREAIGQKLPKTFDGLEVVVDVVGTVKAY